MEEDAKIWVQQPFDSIQSEDHLRAHRLQSSVYDHTKRFIVAKLKLPSPKEGGNS